MTEISIEELDPTKITNEIYDSVLREVIDLWSTQLEINHWKVLYKLCVFYVEFQDDYHCRT
jgi:hypothetical protein